MATTVNPTGRPECGVCFGFIALDRKTLGFDPSLCGDSVRQTELDQAVAHFEDALAFWSKAGCLPELACTCCDSADLLLDHSPWSGRAAGEDRAKPMTLLDEFLVIFSELGMRPLDGAGFLPPGDSGGVGNLGYAVPLN